MKGLIIKQKSKINDKVHFNLISTTHRVKEDAYHTGKRIARKWIKNASSQEIIDVLPRIDTHYDTNYFALMRNNLFLSIEKIYPNETKRFKWFNNIDFMRGWRDEVILIWNNYGN